MSFQPVIAGTGLGGWRFLQRTFDAQNAAFQKSRTIEADTTYFRDRIGQVETAEALVSDRRLLRVALGAFGLGDDIDNRYFVRRILEDGTADRDALANRLADDRYRAFSARFALEKGGTPGTGAADLAPGVEADFRRRQFELAVGEEQNDMRLALNAQTALAEIAVAPDGNDTKWFRMMGNPPLRQVFETAFGLPAGFGRLDIDRQLETFRDRAQRHLGSDDMTRFADPEQVEVLIRKFLLRSQLDTGAASAGSIALTLLQSAVPPAPGR